MKKALFFFAALFIFQIMCAQEKQKEQNPTKKDDAPPVAVCGNGTTEEGETCDDGNTENNDYCSSDCTAVTGRCGDSVKQNNEACDDGNTDGQDSCNSDCTNGCAEGILSANGECLTEKIVSCSQDNIPEHAIAIDEKVKVSYLDGVWSQPSPCLFACKRGYDLADGECINRKMVTCRTPEDKAHVQIPVEIRFSAANGWSEPSECPSVIMPPEKDLTIKKGRFLIGLSNGNGVPANGLSPALSLEYFYMDNFAIQIDYTYIRQKTPLAAYMAEVEGEYWDFSLTKALPLMERMLLKSGFGVSIVNLDIDLDRNDYYLGKRTIGIFVGGIVEIKITDNISGFTMIRQRLLAAFDRGSHKLVNNRPKAQYNDMDYSSYATTAAMGVAFRFDLHKMIK